MPSRAAGGLALFCVLAVPGVRAHAEEVTICYNYGCYARAPVNYREDDLAPLHAQLAAARDARSEREAIANVVGRMYAIAGTQTPVWRDKGGNLADAGENGKMDCIDHSTNTTAFLRLLQTRGWLRFHEVLDPLMRKRFLFADHWAARILERETQTIYIVDSWFVDNGRPAVVFALDDWLGGATPNVQ